MNRQLLAAFIDMSPACQKFLRVVTGVLGVATLFAAAFITRELFTTFSFWKLLLLTAILLAAAKLLFGAFYRRPQWQFRGGSGGATSASVTWPAPSNPPCLSAGAAAAIPNDPQ